ncbi:phosphoenolpyruvate--protein phosphotransferase [Methylovorus sp. SPW-M1]
MIQLETQSIQLNAVANSKAEAISVVGQLLVGNGNMQPAYIQSMLQREQVSNTYLGNGIAIPHGLASDRELIHETGIAIAQFPQGLEWNTGETVYLVIGIAARSDEHIELLANLTHILDDVAAIQHLANTTDPMHIIQRLTLGSAAASDEPLPDDFACHEDVVLRGKAGMHARPATAFVDIARQFECDIRVRCGSKVANGKSMLALLKLGAETQSTLRIMAQGKDETRAVAALAEAVRNGLEDEEELTEQDSQAAHATPVLELTTPAITGIAASPGIAIAPLHRFHPETLEFAAMADDPQHETERLKQAIATGMRQLQALHEEVNARSGAKQAAIFLAHQELLGEPDLLAEAIRTIHLGHSAGWAWNLSVQQKAAEVESLQDALLRERAADLRDVGSRVLRLLAHAKDQASCMPDTPVILVAEDLSPSDTAKLDPTRVLGILTAAGGPTAHTAIIARSLDIPAVVSAGDTVLTLPEGALCILDGDNGKCYISPVAEDIERAEKSRQQRQAIRHMEALACYQPAFTTDGQRIEVVANAGSAQEVELAIQAGAEGIGLLRTEFLFLHRDAPPTEDEQFATYHAMTRSLNGLPLIIRTLDIGGDKEAPYLQLPPEQNPFLGMRGIRLCLAKPELFRTQLRAIYRATNTGPIRIMFPMIASIEELLAAKEIAEEVRKELHAPNVEFGIMIEVPSAVMMAPELARHVNFFSIGTNDLTQYVLAMDRMHPHLARQADALHPAVLRMIDLTVKAAREAGIWVGVCGGIAGDPKGAAILSGLGVSELSVSISSVSSIKARLRKLSSRDNQQLAQTALRCKTAAEVRAL